MSIVNRVEINFPTFVELPEGWDRELSDHVRKVCDAYEETHAGRVMWPSGSGSKLLWLDRPPHFDPSVFAIDVSEREAFEGEREKKAEHRRRTEPVSWVARQILGLVAQVKSQARGLRRYKRRVERLRGELDRSEREGDWKLIYAAQFMLEPSNLASCACADGTCAHENKTKCITTVMSLIEAYMKKSRTRPQDAADAPQSAVETTPREVDPCPASPGESRS